MAPFRNKGWPHFDKFNDIIPNASARGSYAFSPMNATMTAPGRLAELGDDEALAQALAAPHSVVLMQHLLEFKSKSDCNITLNCSPLVLRAVCCITVATVTQQPVTIVGHGVATSLPTS